jgi:glycosyltransferase involved in cell wall biosynthesis
VKNPALLLDVTRLVWRAWRGRLPTGIDRVCLAYLDAFGFSSRAVVQRKGLRLVFGRKASDKLHALLAKGGPKARQRLVWFFLRHGLANLLRRPGTGSTYLNVGHTGLNDEGLVQWIAARQLKAVYLIHDLIPITHPETCRPGESERHRERMRNALRSASGLIGNSQATLDELALFASREGLAMPPSLVAWIAGHAPRSRPLRRAAPSPFFIVLGTIEGRKNHGLLLAAWDRLVAEDGTAAPRLVIVGGRGWQADDVVRRLDDLGMLAPFVEERAECTDQELTGLIADATALLMPSRAEGYGLPLIEALALGTPVIAADLPVYREVVGSLPTYRRPDDVDGWVDAIRSFLRDGTEGQRQAERLTRFRAPDWPAHFAKVMPWLHSLATR